MESKGTVWCERCEGQHAVWRMDWREVQPPFKKRAMTLLCGECVRTSVGMDEWVSATNLVTKEFRTNPTV